jgi:hypothetical protein
MGRPLVGRVTAAVAAALLLAGLAASIGTGPAVAQTVPTVAAKDHPQAPAGHDGRGSGSEATSRPSTPEASDCDVDHDGYRDDDKCTPPPPPPPAPPAPAAAPAPPAPAAPALVVAVQPATISDGVLPCGGTAVEPGDSSAPGAIVTRLSDAAGTDACTPVEYTLRNGGGQLSFVKDNGTPFAQFVVSVDWPAELEAPAKTKTFVDFELVRGGYEVLMPKCPASLYDPVTKELVGLKDIGAKTAADLAAIGITDQDGFPGAGGPADNNMTQYSCVGSRAGRFVPGTPDADPYYAITEQIYLLGDVIWRG